MLTFQATSQLGDVTSDLQTLLTKAPALIGQAVTIVTKAGPYIGTITAIAQDPALPQLVTRIKTLQALQPATTSPGSATPSTGTGIGLARVLPLVDAVIWYERHPRAPWLIGIGTLLAIGGLGFGVGRWSGRRAERRATTR